MGHRGVRLLLISGVDISKNLDGRDPDSPLPDYALLRRELRPDAIDMRTIKSAPSLIVRAVKRRLGPQWAIAVAALLVSRRYDAIYATGEDVGLPLALLSTLVRRRLALIMTCHNIATRRPAFYLGALRLGAAVRTYQCLSRAQATILTGRYGIDPARVEVIDWHVDAQFFRPDLDVPVREQICSAGMASRDYATLVAAVRDLPIDVKIAADSPWFKQEINIAESDLPPRVEARSYGTYAALRRLYAESLFVVVPLLNVEFSAGYTVILEAMAMGKAVIVSRIKQRDDFVMEGHSGYYVEPGNVEQLRERILHLLAHPDETRRLGANGRSIVEQRYTLDDYVQRTQEAVRKIGYH